MALPKPSLPFDAQRLLARVHDVLALLLIVVRPSIWDGESAAWPTLIWYGVLTIALTLFASECLLGWRSHLRWGRAGLLAAVLLALLLPAAWRGPSGYEGLAVWGQWAGHALLAGYLLQIAPGRERLLWAGLVGALTLQVLYAAGQYAWSLPYLAEQARSGAISAGNMQAELQERIAEGGIFGSFTVSNGLAAFLILTIPPLVACLIQRGTRVRWTLLPLVLTALSVLVLTRSKGALVMLAAAVAVMILWYGTRRWRVATVVAGVAGLILVGLSPGLLDGLLASAMVRWGYWQAALELIAARPLSGHGIGGFAAQAAQHLAIGAEYSRYVHNEVLEVTVSAGIAAGVLALLWFALLLRPPKLPATTPDTGTPWVLVLLVPLIAIPYLHVFGVLPAEGWPTASNGMALLPMLMIAAGAGAMMALMLHRPLPPAWAVHTGLAAGLGHALIDFDFAAGGVVAAVVVLAVLAGSGRAREMHFSGWRLLPAVAALALITVLIAGGSRGRALAQAQDLVNEIQALPAVARSEPERFATLLTYRHADLGLPAPTAQDATPRALAALLQRAIHQVWKAGMQWPAADPSQRASLVSVLPPGSDRLPLSAALAQDCPWLAQAHRLHAADLSAIGDNIAAIASLRAAVRYAPWHLPHQQFLATLLAASGQADEAAVIRARVAELAAQVYYRDRPLSEDP